MAPLQRCQHRIDGIFIYPVPRLADDVAVIEPQAEAEPGEAVEHVVLGEISITLHGAADQTRLLRPAPCVPITVSASWKIRICSAKVSSSQCSIVAPPLPQLPHEEFLTPQAPPAGLFSRYVDGLSGSAGRVKSPLRDHLRFHLGFEHCQGLRMGELRAE